MTSNARTSPSSSWRRAVRRVAGLVVIATAVSLVGMAPAQARHRRHHARKKKAAPVNEKALAALRGPFDFGMSKDDVLKILKRQIKEKYAEKISSTTDVYTQDKLRHKRDKEIARIAKSYVAFNGKKSGWEGSIVGDQFRHKTGESMMMFWETDPSSGSDQRRFFFFEDGKLYKMFVALNSDTLKDEQRNFGFLKNIMEARFGPGEVTMVKDRDGNEVPHALHWKTSKYEAWSIDNMDVFGAFCLVIADGPAVARLAEARAKLPKKSNHVRLIDGVIERDSESGPTLDDGNVNIVDKLTHQH